MAAESVLLEAISVGRRRRRFSRDNFEQSNAPEAVTESEHNSVHDSLNGGVDESETKRPRFESSGDNVDGSAPQNGQLEEKKKKDETLDVQLLECLEPVKATAETTTEEPVSNDNDKTNLGSAEEPEQLNAESEKELSNIMREDSAEGQTGSDTQILSRKMEIPDDMVGVLKDKKGESISMAKLIKNVIAKADAGGSPSLVARGFSTDQAASASEQREVSFEKGGVRIGKTRYTIQCLLDNTFAKIQIVSHADKVELFGTLESIKWAERLIQDVIAKADAGGSPSLVVQGFSSDQAASAGEQREVSVQKGVAGCSPALVAQGFSSDQATSAGEQREVSVEKADDGGSPRSVPAILQSDHAAYDWDDRHFVCFDKDSSVLSELSKPHPSASAQSSACRVDKYAHLYLEIDKYGGYHVSTFPEEIPSEYHIE